MPINVLWDNPEKTTILWQYHGDLNLTDIQAAQNVSLLMIQSMLHTVNLIMDVTSSPKLFNGTLANIRFLNHKPSANTGQVILVGTTLLMRTLVKLFQKITPREPGYISFATSADEAHARLAQKVRQPSRGF